jgi:hypothetical protein
MTLLRLIEIFSLRDTPLLLILLLITIISITLSLHYILPLRHCHYIDFLSIYCDAIIIIIFITLFHWLPLRHCHYISLALIITPLLLLLIIDWYWCHYWLFSLFSLHYAISLMTFIDYAFDIYIDYFHYAIDIVDIIIDIIDITLLLIMIITY